MSFFVKTKQISSAAQSYHAQRCFHNFLRFRRRKQARSKVQRMMHYEVSLRPFVATVQGPSMRRPRSPNGSLRDNPPFSLLNEVGPMSRYEDFGGGNSCTPSPPSGGNGGSYGDSSNTPSSPFMYTPQSFPPTPHSRQIVMARGGRFADDVLFLARDRLRLHDSLESENERTREMAKLLREGKRLAVFNARDTANGIELTWYVDSLCYPKRGIM